MRRSGQRERRHPGDSCHAADWRIIPLRPSTTWLEEMTPDKIPGFNIALDVVTFIAVVVGFLAIFQSMYTAVMERTREIGILKSMGASKWTIVDVVLRETAVHGGGGCHPGNCRHLRRASFSCSTSFPCSILRLPACGLPRALRSPLWERSGRALSGLDGRPQGPHRRAGLRIVL